MTTFGADHAIYDNNRRFVKLNPSLSKKHVKKADYSSESSASEFIMLLLEGKSVSSQPKTREDVSKMVNYINAIDSIEGKGCEFVRLIGPISSGNLHFIPFFPTI